MISALSGVLLAMPLIREAFGLPGAPAAAGADSLVGETAVVIDHEPAPGSSGWVVLRGERWRVRSDPVNAANVTSAAHAADVTIAPGTRVCVQAVDGLELVVDELPEGERASPRLVHRPSPLWWVSALVGWGAAVGLALVQGGSVVGAVFACPIAALALLVSLGGFEFG